MPEHPGFDCLWPTEGARLAVRLAPWLEVGIAACEDRASCCSSACFRGREHGPTSPVRWPASSVFRAAGRSTFFFTAFQFFNVIPGKPRWWSFLRSRGWILVTFLEPNHFCLSSAAFSRFFSICSQPRSRLHPTPPQCMASARRTSSRTAAAAAAIPDGGTGSGASLRMRQ